MIDRLIRISFAVMFSFATTALFAQEDFSADIVNFEQGKPTSPGKLYVTKDKVRFEAQGTTGHGGVVILNFAAHTTDMLMPEHKMYMEMAAGQGPAAQRTWAFFRPADAENACSDWQKLANRSGGECHKLGSALVNGRSTTEYEGKSANGDVTHVWLDSKIAFPVKWEDKNSRGELQNIKTGPQPASLFEIPADYQKMQMPAGMPNMPPR